jgi:hypothetical protein
MDGGWKVERCAVTDDQMFWPGADGRWLGASPQAARWSSLPLSDAAVRHFVACETQQLPPPSNSSAQLDQNDAFGRRKSLGQSEGSPAHRSAGGPQPVGRLISHHFPDQAPENPVVLHALCCHRLLIFIGKSQSLQVRHCGTMKLWSSYPSHQNGRALCASSPDTPCEVARQTLRQRPHWLPPNPSPISRCILISSAPLTLARMILKHFCLGANSIPASRGLGSIWLAGIPNPHSGAHRLSCTYVKT